MISSYFLIFRLICLNPNLNLVRNQVQTREELTNYLVIPMLTVSCSRPVELEDQTIGSIIKNQKSYQTVARLRCIVGKRHILQALHRFMAHLVSTILVLGPRNFKLDLELQTCIYEKIGLNLVNDPKFSWKTRAKHRTNRGTNAATQNVQMFHVFFAVQIQIFHFFGKFKPCLNYIIDLSPCHRIILNMKL